jgi:hypothetical protein
MKIRHAVKYHSYVKLALAGLAGAGKSVTALETAMHLSTKAIAVIDADYPGAVSKYAKDQEDAGFGFCFDVLEIMLDERKNTQSGELEEIEIEKPFRPQRFLEAVRMIYESGRFDVLVIDGMSSEWDGKGGMLEWVDELAKHFQNRKVKDPTRRAWSIATPEHRKLFQYLLSIRMHVIITLSTSLLIPEQTSQDLLLLRARKGLSMKTQQQLNEEYTTTLKNLNQFCGRMSAQTGWGAPEKDIFQTTRISIATAWKQPEKTLEEVVRERMQDDMASHRKRLSEFDDRTPCPLLSDRIEYTRRLAAYEDLWQRMDSNEWGLPSAIPPLVFCLVIDPHAPSFSFERFFSVLYHADVCDLRASFASGFYGQSRLSAQARPASYQRIQLSDPDGQKALHSALECKAGERLVLLIHPEQHGMEVVLLQQFPPVEFVFLPEPLPAVLF